MRFSATPASPGVAKVDPRPATNERISVVGVISAIDYDVRQISLLRSSQVITVLKDAKFVGDNGDSRREFSIFDLSAGMKARFEGYAKDSDNLIADYVLADNSANKQKISVASQ